MFWGLTLKPNHKYTQTTLKSFHISHAALDSTTCKGDPTQLFVYSDEGQKYLICTLHKTTCEQVTLNLNFKEGDKISFQANGSGAVTLSGYLVDHDFVLDDEFDDGEEEEESSADLRQLLAKKKKKHTRNAQDDADSDEEEDDSDFDASALLEEDGDGIEGDSDEGDEDVEEEDDDEDDDEEEEEEDSEEEVPAPKKKKLELSKPGKQQNGIANDINLSSQKADKKGKKKQQQQQQPQQQQQQNQEKQQQKQQKRGAGERVLSGGVKIEELRVGNGPEAKTGKRVQVYYEGRLKSNNKVFDSLKQGAGFKFKLGGGEVIKGWDVGIVGMKVGGRRRIICPPHMAYGSTGSPPAIPPNSTLMFEVELKNVN